MVIHITDGYPSTKCLSVHLWNKPNNWHGLYLVATFNNKPTGTASFECPSINDHPADNLIRPHSCVSVRKLTNRCCSDIMSTKTFWWNHQKVSQCWMGCGYTQLDAATINHLRAPVTTSMFSCSGTQITAFNCLSFCLPSIICWSSNIQSAGKTSKLYANHLTAYQRYGQLVKDMVSWSKFQSPIVQSLDICEMRISNLRRILYRTHLQFILLRNVSERGWHQHLFWRRDLWKQVFHNNLVLGQHNGGFCTSLAQSCMQSRIIVIDLLKVFDNLNHDI